MGRTGSGKSTIAALMARMYDPIKGNVTIDGHPLKKVNLDSLRSSMGYGPLKKVFLFSDSIYNNIAFGLDVADEKVVTDAAKLAGIHENIMDFPEQYETKVGERGVTLSGGSEATRIHCPCHSGKTADPCFG